MQEKKRILIISNMFFPQPSVGAVRVTQWSRFMPDYGWQPTILCRYYGFVATPDLLREKLNPDVRVEYLNAPQRNIHPPEKERPTELPRWKAMFASSVLAQWSVPDLSVRFWRAARARALKFVQQLNPDVILTTSPPHGLHDLGIWLSKQVDIPWVADFRDPFLIDPRFRRRGIGRLRWRAQKEYERQIYERAAMIVHAIPLQARWARRAYPAARTRIVTLSNGCPVELAESQIEPAEVSDNRICVCLAGAVAAAEVALLAGAMRELIDSGLNLELRLVGTPPPNLNVLQELLGDRLVATGPLRHDFALQHIVGAHVLLCTLDSERAKGMGISSKLFEYVATGKPIIVINPYATDRQFFRRFKGVHMLDAPSREDLRSALQWAVDPVTLPPVEQARQFKKRYNRRTQTAELAEWLHKVADKRELQIHAR
jgi:glycosyltransferase involved in cell wall biosynthesis